MVEQSPDEPTTFHQLYSTNRTKGLPASLHKLYPKIIPSRLYLGTAGSCPNGGPGLSYSPFDYEADWCVTLVRVVDWGAPQAPVPVALYRLRDQGGTLLYVGVSDNPRRRFKDHSDDKPWWAQVAHRSIEWFPSRARALAAESTTIRVERPRYNVQHNGRSAP